MEPVRVGLIGCGNISDTYLSCAKQFPQIRVVACADIISERAETKARKHGVPEALTVDALLAHPDVDVVLNLTVPAAHAEVAMRALAAGKSVYNEKPLAATHAEGQALVDAAARAGRLLGGAPDTFLGGGLQTCRKLIDDGWIGRPVAATAFMMCPGHEHWHPDPGFFYQAGGGPLFDMGPYYLTALVSLLGPIAGVSGVARASFPERLITSQPHFGSRIAVETPTHIAGTLEFRDGALASLVMSFDVQAHELPHIEIYGTEGSLSVPDPNQFCGPVRISRKGSGGWQEMPLTHGYTEQSRSIGIADMAAAWRMGRPHRASGSLALHVLDVMQALLEAAESGTRMGTSSHVERPAPLPMGLLPGQLD